MKKISFFLSLILYGITVFGTNSVNIILPPGQVFVGASLTFTVQDPDPTISYKWRFGDGSPEAVGISVTHAFKEPKLYMTLPGVWTGKTYNNKKLGSFGHATYRAKILLNESEKNLAIKVITAGTSMEIIIDNKISYYQGKVGINETSSIPEFKPGILKLKTNKTDLDIILHISNYHHAKDLLLK